MVYRCFICVGLALILTDSHVDAEALENSESAADGKREELIGDGVEGAPLAPVDAEALPDDPAATLVPEENLVDGVALGAFPVNREGTTEGPSPSTPSAIGQR